MLYSEACFAVSEREEKMDKVAEIIEKDFVIVGSTAIEDRL